MLNLHQKLTLWSHSDVILYDISMGKASYKRIEQLLMYSNGPNPDILPNYLSNAIAP
jgi:hypothetical protein